jgi:hypothetical protein
MAHEIGAQFWFRSDLFDIEPGEDQQTNPSFYGKQLAHWVFTRLGERGYTPEAAAPEDWGWCVMCLREPFLLWVGCANVDNPDNDAAPASGRDVIWSCFVAAEKPFFSNPFKKLDAGPAVSRLGQEVESMLRSEPRITLTEEP